MRYLPNKKKILQALPLSLLRGSRLKSVRASSKEYTRSSPNFIQIRFTSGGLIAKRVNIVETRHKVFPILDEASSPSNKQIGELNVCWNSVIRRLFGYNRWESVKAVLMGLGRLNIKDLITLKKAYKSSAVAEMGDRGHNRHGPKRGGGCCAPFAERWEPV